MDPAPAPGLLRQAGSATVTRARRTSLARWVPPASLIVLLSLGGCYPRPVDPVGIPTAPPPFIRLPYVQNVTHESASVLWMSAAGSADSAWYRVPGPGSEWIPSTVVEHRHGSRRIDIGGLPAASVVEYVVSAGGTHAGPFAFGTAPPPGEPAEVRVLQFGDSGWGGPEQIALARRMASEDWDLIVHVGDIAYNDGSESEFTERHFRVYADILAETPFFPSVGNHDVRADGGRSYDGAFLWPEPFPGVRYYSFRWGRTLFVSVDTSSRTEDVEGLREGWGRQLEWLRETLRDASSDPTVDWIVVFQHYPLYSHATGISGHALDRDLRKQMLPIVEAYGADLILAGHDHHYERDRPIREGRPVEDGCGPVNVLSGGGGGSRYARAIQNTILLAAAARAYTYVELRIEEEAIRGRAINRQGEVMDEFVVRPYAGTARGLPERCAE